jgi:hypothetical protein
MRRKLGSEAEAARQAGERVVSTGRGQTRGNGWVGFGVLGRTRGAGCTARRSAVSTGGERGDEQPVLARWLR